MREKAIKLGWATLVCIETIIRSNASEYFILKSSFGNFEWYLSETGGFKVGPGESPPALLVPRRHFTRKKTNWKEDILF